MSDSWRTVRLGDVADLNGGYAFKSTQYTEQGRFVLRTVNIRDDYSITKDGATFISEEEASEYSRFDLRDRDTLFVMVAATLGKVGYVRSEVLPALLNQNMWVIRAKPGLIEPDFLQFCFRELSKIPLAWVSGSARSFLRRDDVRNLEFALPPLPEQRAIAATLGALDDKIELNRKMNATLEAMARALFRDWFVDFGPTRAKMEGRAAYLSPNVWALFPDRLDDEGTPEGWEVRPLVDCFDLLMGQSQPGDTYNDSGDGLPFFQGRTDFGFRYPENRKYCSAPTRVAEKGDTLVSVRAPVGDINLASERCCIGRGVAALRHKVGGASFTYYTAWSLQEEFRQYENTGTVFGAINKKQFEKIPTVDPGPAVIKAFEGVVIALDSRIKNNERESRTLAQTRDLLLPRLMSGELRVAEAERIVEEVV